MFAVGKIICWWKQGHKDVRSVVGWDETRDPGIAHVTWMVDCLRCGRTYHQSKHVPWMKRAA